MAVTLLLQATRGCRFFFFMSPTPRRAKIKMSISSPALYLFHLPFSIPLPRTLNGDACSSEEGGCLLPKFAVAVTKDNSSDEGNIYGASHFIGGICHLRVCAQTADSSVEECKCSIHATTLCIGCKGKRRNNHSHNCSTVNGSVEQADSTDPDAEGLPWWWEYLFKLPALQPAPQGTDCTFADSATNVLRTNINIEQIYGGFPSLDKCPLGEGEITDIADGTMFIGLQRYQQQ